MDQKMTALERIEALGNVLDKLGDLPIGGRGKCGLVWVANDLLTGIKNDVLIMENQLRSQEISTELEPKSEEVASDE